MWSWIKSRFIIKGWVLIVLKVTAIVFALGMGYVLYLTERYQVDEVFHVDRLRDLLLEEKLTIRVHAPLDRSQLKQFILHYSICPTVQEIQVLWAQPDLPPAPEDFPYTLTHSQVTFHALSTFHSDPYLTFFPADSSTESVLLLDGDVFIDCSDLAFMLSVWRSSKVSTVGFYPRHVESTKVSSKGKEKTVFAYGGPRQVLWRQRYSLLSSAALLLHASYLKSLSASKEMRDFLSRKAQCVEWVVPLWARAQGARAPIWVDVTPTLASNVERSAYPKLFTTATTSRSVVGNSSSLIGSASPSHLRSVAKQVPLDDNQRSQCITEIASLLKIDHLPFSHNKALQAKRCWIW